MSEANEVERVVMCHIYRHQAGCMVCTKCGTAKHNTKYQGFKYWFAGVGYKGEPECR